ncbi:hypothetical protein VARIO8X_110123 [Burkholderiales bacterium 8X]|nr:hypothetical protein VARIO8X_110123 [Burkholderiales bacterium 8X]
MQKSRSFPIPPTAQETQESTFIFSYS